MEEKAEIEKSIDLADLVKPNMHDGLDFSLLTQKEVDLLDELQDQHDRLFRQRAIQLRFYPDVMNGKEEEAVFRCMNYTELIPYYGIVAIHEKNRRLQQILVSRKVEIRRYCRMTKQLIKASNSSKIGLPDISIANITEDYFSEMKKMDEKTYEIPYYFLKQEDREKMLQIYSTPISKNQIVTDSRLPNQASALKVDGDIDE